LKRWALEHDTDASVVVRTLLSELTRHPDLTDRIARRISEEA